MVRLICKCSYTYDCYSINQRAPTDVYCYLWILCGKSVMNVEMPRAITCTIPGYRIPIWLPVDGAWGIFANSTVIIFTRENHRHLFVSSLQHISLLMDDSHVYVTILLFHSTSCDIMWNFNSLQICIYLHKVYSCTFDKRVQHKHY